MIRKPLEEIDKATIDALVATKVSERRTLEYKEKLPGNGDDEKREFLYDVSSFANAAGGDLIFGVRDERGDDGKPTGVPESAPGISGFANLSAEIARLENLIQSSIAPRIAGIRFSPPIQGFTDGSVLIIRIPKSWSTPHMVTFKGATRFYSRNSTGKYPLDVAEIRSAFAISEALPERLKTFRQQRLASIVAEDTPIPLPRCAKLVLHVVPMIAVTSTAPLDVAAYARELDPQLAPMGMTVWDKRLNFDGFLTYNPFHRHYVQLFRSGALEAVDTTALNLRLTEDVDPKGAHVSLSILEERVIQAVGQYLKVQKTMQIPAPVSVMVTLLGVKGYAVATEAYYIFSSNTIDRDTLILPDLIVEDFDSSAEKVLKPIFDAIAQSAGLAGSFNYDAEGNRKR